jgi:glyoxylase-like metal-dependent hydrolase (beta-lactamase superfamily II)
VKLESRVVGPFEENAYLVIDESTTRAVLVDPGDEPDVLVAMVEKSKATLDAIWLTHAHLDHIGGIAGVRRKWNVPIYLHAADLPLYVRAEQQAAMYGVPFEQPDEPDYFITDGDTLRVGSVVFTVIHTPGHSPGHVVLLNDRTMIGGDLLFAGSIGRTDLPLADPARMEESLAKICELDGGIHVHPGHGPSTTIARERASNPFLNGLVRIVGR